MANAVDTLLIPLETAETGGTSFFFNAALPELPGNALPDGIRCEQPHRGAFLTLQRAGIDVVSDFGDLPKGQADLSLVLAGRHRRENEIMIARASAATRSDGAIYVAGDKTAGIASLRKFVSRHTRVDDAIAKYHAQVFRCWVSEALSSSATGKDQDESVAGFETAPGMFSSGKIDTGSAVLARHVTEKITGSVADFGAGWGYLSRTILEQGRPASLALYESHWPSLQAAERNLSGLGSGVDIKSHWLDLTSEAVPRQFDWIVMNPPFHAGRKAEPSIGERFIQTASKALKPGGRLLMVANQTLGYERSLEAGFARFSELERDKGFKVLLAQR